jgi:hypothetical protein
MGKAGLLFSEVSVFLKEILFKDDAWIIFIRNIIAWITKDNFYFKKSTYISVAYEQSVKTVNLPQYDCILIEKLI